MKRREFLKAMGAFAVVAPSVASAVSASETKYVGKKSPLCEYSGRKPNVILVLCDDLGWGDLGEFWQNKRKDEGYLHIDTPNLDKAMQRGVMLTHAYTTSPVCAPARASMVTGKNQGHCNLRNNSFDCPIATDMTLGTVMKQAGYATWHIGKWGIGGGYESAGTQPRRAMACDAGFDYSYGYPAHAHGHSFYRFEALDDDTTHIQWRTSKQGSPCVENISKAVYEDQDQFAFYAKLSEGSKVCESAASETDYHADVEGMQFEADADGTYYRRLVSDAEARFCYDTDLFTAKIKQLIKAHLDADRAEPFFCYACYTTVHGSGSSAQSDPKLGTVKDFHVPGAAYPAQDATDTVWGGGVKWVKDEETGYLPFKEGVVGDNTSNSYIYDAYQEYTDVSPAPDGSRARYATNVRRLDDALGDLLHFLKLRGIAEETLFIFTSDNGPAGEYVNSSSLADRLNWVETRGFDSNGPYKGMKRWSYEGGVREPTFAVWEGTIPANGEGATPRKITHPFQFPAWMATLADVAGLPQPAHCDGISILPVLTNSGTQLAARIYAEYQDGGSGMGYGFQQMVRDGDYVLIRNGGSTASPELYNVIEDEGQTTNLASDTAYADRLAWMKNLLLTCRIPMAKVLDACGAYGAYAVGSTAGTPYVSNYGATTVGSTPHGLDSATLPAIDLKGALPKTEARLYFNGAETWPWVPNFRTLVPDAGLLMDNAAALKAKLPEGQAAGVALRGWLEFSADTTVTITASGAGGCQLWLHEAHVLEYEAGDCTKGKSTSYTLAAGRHPYKLYLTTTSGADGLCSVSIGSTTII